MITIIGGLITRQIGSSVTYVVKCEKCENVESQEFTVSVTRGVTDITTKKCTACGNNQPVKLKHVVDK